ncbi:MAG: prepilin peptidase [Acidobacteria bacterium]|nr:prepilin peptidase [Acidobacteriota bacterium]
MTSRTVYEIAGFFLGLIVGSFLNVCISRLPQHESIVHPRSQCPNCKSRIRWHDNIPIVSWVLLRARCRDCHQPIALRYPLVELATGIWFAIQAARLYTVLHFYFFDPAQSSGTSSYAEFAVIANIAVTLIGVFLIGLIVMDLQTGLLPDSFTLTGTAVGLFIICVQAVFLGPTEGEVLLTRNSIKLSSPGGVTDSGNVFLTGPEALVGGRILAICGVALLLLLVRWIYKAVRHREGMGLGDVKLLAMIAAFLGFWPAILSLFIGTLGAAIYGAFLLAKGRGNPSSKLAFGAFLGAGGLIVAQVGDRIIEAYAQLLR